MAEAEEEGRQHRCRLVVDWIAWESLLGGWRGRGVVRRIAVGYYDDRTDRNGPMNNARQNLPSEPGMMMVVVACPIDRSRSKHWLHAARILIDVSEKSLVRCLGRASRSATRCFQFGRLKIDRLLRWWGVEHSLVVLVGG